MPTTEIRYSDQATSLSGVMALDETLPTKRPGVLVVHGGAGLDEELAGPANFQTVVSTIEQAGQSHASL